MRPERDLPRLLAAMPFLDRLELVAVSGWSRGAVYGSIRALEEAGLVASLPHASELVAPTRRYALTAAGLRRLAAEERVGMHELLRSRPLSAHGRRILLERLDAVAVIYRLASEIANLHYPIRFRWYRAMPMDAAIALPDGRTVAVVRQGHTADRTAYAKRLWRLREGPRPGAFLLLAPDEVRLRHTRRLMTGAPAPAFLALERDAISSGPGARIWRTASGSPLLGLGEVLSHVAARGAWPEEQPPALASFPRDLPADPPGSPADWMLPALLKPTEKRVLDLLCDWPWITPAHLGVLLGLGRSRLSAIVQRLEAMGLLVDSAVAGRRRLGLSDRGLAVLSRRDRASVGDARKRWSIAPLDPGAAGWRNVSGRRSRQLLRNIEHTASVHAFISALAEQARASSWEVGELDPPRRASRYFPYDDRLHSIQPDAFGMLHRGDEIWPFFLEWERRAVHPATMAARLAPYLRYYASHRPTDDHGARPAVLVVFDDELAANHFLRVAQGELERARVAVPLRVSFERLLRAEGPLGRAWRVPGAPHQQAGPLSGHAVASSGDSGR